MHEDEYAKSFQVGGPSKKFVNVTLPSTCLCNNNRRVNKRQVAIQEATLLHNLLPQLLHHFPPTSLPPVRQRRLRRLLPLNDKQVASLWRLRLTLHKQRLIEEEEVNALDIINTLCVFDLPEEWETGRIGKVEISDIGGWEYGASAGGVEKSE